MHGHIPASAACLNASIPDRMELYRQDEMKHQEGKDGEEARALYYYCHDTEDTDERLLPSQRNYPLINSIAALP